MQPQSSSHEWYAASPGCERCNHPAWAHGPGAICSECDASPSGGACGLLSLYGFDLTALPRAAACGEAANATGSA